MKKIKAVLVVFYCVFLCLGVSLTHFNPEVVYINTDRTFDAKENILEEEMKNFSPRSGAQGFDLVEVGQFNDELSFSMFLS